MITPEQQKKLIELNDLNIKCQKLNNELNNYRADIKNLEADRNEILNELAKLWSKLEPLHKEIVYGLREKEDTGACGTGVAEENHPENHPG
ncbi:MAG: hypothetical protein OXD01_05010 [Gammaproteobacteria bacterium]|nr:hypothetical protein [Gammaproteobacteria bacterium]